MKKIINFNYDMKYEVMKIKITIILIFLIFDCYKYTYADRWHEKNDYEKIAIEAYNNQDYLKAILMFKKVLKIDADNSFYNQYLGKSYLKIQRYKEAQYYFNLACKTEPDGIDSRFDFNELKYDMALLKFKTSNYYRAINLFNELIEIDSSNYLAKYYIGMCYQRLGYVEKAIEQFESIIEHNTTSLLKIMAKKQMNLLQKNDINSYKYDLNDNIEPEYNKLKIGIPSLCSNYEMTFKSDIIQKKLQSSVEMNYGNVSFSLPLIINENNLISLGLSFDWTSFEWFNLENIEFTQFKQPWKTLRSNIYNIDYLYKHNNNFSICFGGYIGVAWEGMDKIFSLKNNESYYSCYLISVYKTGNCSYSLGCLFSHQQILNHVSPILGFEWKSKSLTEKKFGCSLKLGAPETEIRYSFNNFFDIYFNASSFQNIYRLNDDNEIFPTYLLEINSLDLGVHADLRLSKFMKFSLGLTNQSNIDWILYNNNNYRKEKSNVEINDSTKLTFGLFFDY